MLRVFVDQDESRYLGETNAKDTFIRPCLRPGRRYPPPATALAYRRTNGLLSQTDLGALNITAWLYCDKQGIESVQVNPNVTIAQLRQLYGSAATPDAELGFHSEAMAAEWFPDHQSIGPEVFSRFSRERLGKDGVYR